MFTDSGRWLANTTQRYTLCDRLQAIHRCTAFCASRKYTQPLERLLPSVSPRVARSVLAQHEPPAVQSRRSPSGLQTHKPSISHMCMHTVHARSQATSKHARRCRWLRSARLNSRPFIDRAGMAHTACAANFGRSNTAPLFVSMHVTVLVPACSVFAVTDLPVNVCGRWPDLRWPLPCG